MSYPFLDKPKITISFGFLLGIYWIIPICFFAMLADRFLCYHLPYAISFLIVGYLGLLHYFSEAFTWRSASPYRQHVFLR